MAQGTTELTSSHNENQTIASREELLRRAEALVPKLVDRAGECTRQGRVPIETIEEMQQAGFFRMLQPRRNGGFETDPNTVLDVIEILAEGCMSTAWICAVQGSIPFAAAQFAEQTRADIWGKDPTNLIAGQLMPARNLKVVDDGYIVSGQWPYVSGCDHSNWYMLGAVAPEGGGPNPGERILMLVPREDCRILDTWDVSGLRGTGSHDVSATEIFVPFHRTILQSDAFMARGPGMRPGERSIYLVPFAQIFTYGLTCTAVGALSGMFKLFLHHGSARVSAHGLKSADEPAAQLLCAETATALEEMVMTRRRNFEEMMIKAMGGEMAAIEDRRKYKFQGAFSVERATLLAARIFKAAGGLSVYSKVPFGRFFADIHVSRQHVTAQFDQIGRNWGAQMLGGALRNDPMV
jgi:3-hydroxy-9,10-secoandrosta-1,3,5(10)-triene-9,17-dione monooxygenase